MALSDLINVINKVDCSGGAVKGTGLAGCRVDRKRVVTLELTPRNYRYTDVPNLVYTRAGQAAGDIIILQGVVTFVDNTSDDNIITREGSGIKKVAGKNPYEFTATFDNGIPFHQALVALSSYGQYNMALYDVDGNKFLTQTKSGAVKGFTVGMLEAGKYMGQNGTESSSETLTFQLLDRAEMDTNRQVWIDADSLDFSPSTDIDGVNETVITINPLATGATSIIIFPLLSDKTHLVEGLLLADFRLTKNGTVLTPTAMTYNTSAKTVTFTVAALAAADVITVSLDNIVLTLEGVLYKSNTATAIVV